MGYVCDTKSQKANKVVLGIKKEQSVVLPVTSISNGKACGALVVDICWEPNLKEINFEKIWKNLEFDTDYEKPFCIIGM